MYVFTLHVLHTISHSLGFSIFFSWDVLVWRSFVFLWSKIWRACGILCSILVNVLCYLLSTLLDLWINRPNGFDTFLKGFIFISHCYSLVPQFSSRREFKVTRWVEFRLKVSLAARDKVDVGFSVLPWFILEERYLCKRWRTSLPHGPKLGFHGQGVFFCRGQREKKIEACIFSMHGRQQSDVGKRGCSGGAHPKYPNKSRTSLQKYWRSYVGLSAAVFTDLGIALFAGDPAIFLLMFAIAPAVFIGGAFVRGLESFAAFHARMPPLPASSCCVRRVGETLAHLSAATTRSSQAGTRISHHDDGTFWMMLKNLDTMEKRNTLKYSLWYNKTLKVTK